MVHPNAAQNMKQKISDLINNCVIKDKWPEFNSIYDHTIALSKEVSKHYGRWLKEDTLFDIVYDNIRESLNKKFPENYLAAIETQSDTKEISGFLKDILGQKAVTNLVDSISDLIASIPRQYNVYFPLPTVLNLHAKHIILSDEISFLKFDKTDTTPTLPKCDEESLVNALVLLKAGIKKKLEVDTYYIVIKVSGYIHGNIDDITFIESLSKFKQIMQMGIILKLFNKTFTTRQRFSYAPRNSLNTIIVDMEKPNNISSAIQLPNDIVLFANNITLRLDSRKHLQTLKHDESAIIGYFKEKLDIPIKLISAPDENVDAKSIKTAVEWAFDSSLEENETISFIKVCIGLEAILGEETGREPLTETLADRCAYLLAKTIGERKEIRKMFRRLYELRSKIVHGRTMRLREKERAYLIWGQEILGQVIAKEMSLLKL